MLRRVSTSIAQIGVFFLGWFAAGLLVALVLGKFIHEANQLDDERSYATEPSHESVSYLRQSKRKIKNKRQRRAKVAAAHSEKAANRATS